MSSPLRILAIAVICSAAAACSGLVEPSIDMGGVYTLEIVDGPPLVQGAGTLILTRQGYAERRVRYRNPDASLSMEYVSRGEAAVRSDSTIYVEFRDVEPRTGSAWHPEVRLTRTGVELVRYGAYDGTRIVETYRKQ
jgi:hypothetical protein